MNLDRIWLARWNQNIEEAMQSLAACQVARGWTLTGAKDLLRVSDADYDEYLDALLLKASLLRARSQTRESGALLARIERVNRELGRTTPFRMHFELGLDHWISEAVPQALDSFLLAEQSARTPVEKVFALSNLLWCLEALDLNRDRIETKLEKLLVTVEGVDHVQQQLDAYRLRKRFYEGNFVAPKDPQGQSRYFVSWCASLPYMNESNDGAALDFMDSKYLWQGSYRIRTLTGSPLPADLSTARLGDAIDRLYLWVWLWIAGDSRIGDEKLRLTLNSIAEQLEGEFLSRENQLLLRNALAWLQLLCPSLTESFRKTLLDLSAVSSARYPLLEREFIFINNLADAPALYFFPRTLKMVRIAQQLTNRKKLNEKYFYDLVIDASQGVVERVSTGEVTVSPTLAQLLIDLGKTGFSLLPGKAGRQIHNLVARAKRLHPALNVQVHGKRISVKGGRPRMLLVNESARATAMADSKVQPRVRQTPQSAIGLQAARALFESGFTREQIEKTFKTSKASACRWIQEWLDSGQLLRQGLGKKVRYQWKS